MASVKWLTRIVATDKPFDGFFQSLQYSRWERMNGTPTLIPVT
jgi:DMSO/TMAO reductase YedYZ molybdopterin-dependent catalytic subunit